MKNKRLLISLLCMAIFVVTIIGLTIFAILYKHDEYEIHNISITGYGYRYNDSVDLDFGKHKVKDFSRSKNDNGEKYKMSFEVESGEDFYNNVIKTHEAYNPELEFETTRYNYLSYGYMVIDNCIFHYEVMGNYIEIEPSYGTVDTRTVDIIILGGFSINIHIDEIDKEPVKTTKYSLLSRQCWDYISHNDFLKLFSYIDSDLYKIEDNILYLKGIYYDYKTDQRHITDNYYVTISNVDGTPTLSLI